MSRSRPEDVSIENDSFLDIVANIVGILIILVVLVGVRAKHAPLTASIPGPAPVEEKAESGEPDGIEWKLREETLDINRQGLQLAEEAIVRDQQRNQLAMMVAAAERNLEDERNRLEGTARAEYDLERNLAQEQARLSDAIRASLLAQQDQSAARPVDLEHRPTPISHTVHGREIHLLLDEGRVVVVPFEKLVEQFKQEFERKAYRLQQQSELTDKMGPLDGFRLRYTIERIDITGDEYMQTGRTGSVIRLRRIEFLPENKRLGETVDEALADGSLLRETLALYRPDRDTVTIWAYPDGFGDCQRLKKLLYRLGYSVAARPLPYGVPISASPDGSRSAAQ